MLRRGFIVILLLAPIGLLCSQNVTPGAAQDPDADQREMRARVSEADLVYTEPADRSEAGMPLGNGVMGTLVWTTPSAVKMQINRVDVFGMNKASDSFMERHSDYASGCGYVDIQVVDYGDDVFSGESFTQHLHLYDGLMAVKGKGLTMRLIALNNRDVIAVEVEDNRETPQPIRVNLRMLRYLMQYFPGENFELSRKHSVKIKRRGHTATSRLQLEKGKILLTQEFSENDFYNSSALAVGISGRAAKACYLNESTLQLTAAPGTGKFTITIASASSTENVQHAVDRSLGFVDAAARETFAQACSDQAAWWHAFWDRSYVDLHSADGVADEVEKHYTYFHYIMASSSRGLYQPRFGGMLWYTNGDMRDWGTQYWWSNESCYYNALAPTGRLELMDPLFSMVSRHLDTYATAARQQWGSEGLWIPETTFFDGVAEMPEEIAAEMRDLYLLKKPWDERSDRFRKYAATKPKHNPRWNWASPGRWENGHWLFEDKGAGPFGHVTHMFSSTAERAYLYWLRYEYSQDMDWLRNQAYPVMKGAIEFYRHFPGMKKEKDGKYHVYHTNCDEGIWDAHNSFRDIVAIRGLTPIVIRAAELLKTDQELIPVWKEFVENMSPLPTTGALSGHRPGAPDYWIGCVPPAGRGDAEGPQHMIYFDYCTIGTSDPRIVEKAKAAFTAMYKEGVTAATVVPVLDKRPIVAALLGNGEVLKYLLPNQIRSDGAPERDFCDWKGGGAQGVLKNRMTLREGPGALGCQRLGNVATALNSALLQSVPPEPGGEPVIHLFPAWPSGWDASFKLLARRGFMVSSAIKNKDIGPVEILAQHGGTCILKNPWPGASPMIYRNGKEAGREAGEYLKLETTKGERLQLVR